MFNLFNLGNSNKVNTNLDFNIFGSPFEPSELKTSIRRRKKRNAEKKAKDKKGGDDVNLDNINTDELDELLLDDSDETVEVKVNDGSEEEIEEPIVVDINDSEESASDNKKEKDDNPRFVTINVKVGNDEEKLRIEREFSYIEIPREKLIELFMSNDLRFSITTPNLSPNVSPVDRLKELERIYSRAISIVK